MCLVTGAERDRQPRLVLLQLQVRAQTRSAEFVQQRIQQHRLRHAGAPLPGARLPQVEERCSLLIATYYFTRDPICFFYRLEIATT